jgi:Ca-activated chloride channel family protein
LTGIKLTLNEETMTRIKQLLFILLLTTAVMACGLIETVEEAVNDPLTPTTTVSIVYGSEKRAWLEPLVEAFNSANHTTSTGNLIRIEAEPMGSIESVDKIISGEIQPTVWSPASSIYIPVANDQWRRNNGADLVDSNPNDLVLSPVVIAMWRPMAEALGWPDKAIGWSDIFELSISPEGWRAYGYPEWGDFKFGHTHPEFSNSGITSVLAEAYAGAGKVRDLTEADVQSPAVRDFMGEVEKSVIHYGRSTGFFADQLFNRGPSYLSAAVLYENLIVEQEQRRLSGESPQLPVVAIYPKEGTFWANHPYAVLNADWVSDDQREAAELFETFLLDTAQQERAISLGFRPADPSIALASPLDSQHGVDPQQPQTILEVPSAAVTDAALSTWREVKKPVDLVVVMDISGSMSGDKIAAARQSLGQFLELLGDRDRVQIILFNNELIEMTPLTPLGEKRTDLQNRIAGIVEGGDTSLYDAVNLGYDQLLSNGDPDHIKAMVVLSDGEDTSSNATLNQVTQALSVNLSEGGNAPKIFTIAFGSGADTAVLKQISDVTGGKQYGGDADSIYGIYIDIATFF